ncbi:hypothetical protein [uncultured Formosa sp.]|uniref:hypothetical protein n=1 Tax=uncultured Formosa sp. TaxID=255435 RepID=UPI0026150AB2|nr:hypothetical protein [uncultured Formosa sp.]
MILLLMFFHVSGYAQSENDMTNNTIIIPLKIGENPSSYFKTLQIEPDNLFIQSKPTTTDSPHIQLALNIIENNKKYTTYLWAYNDSLYTQKTNYPKAYNNYAFNLKIDNENVDLVVEQLDFEIPFFIDIKQTAILGNLNIVFEACMGEWSEDIEGNQVAAFNTYAIKLLEENEQKILSFSSLDESDTNTQILEWKNYTILVLEDSEKALKLKVSKKN